MHAEYATAWLPGEDSPPSFGPAAVELVVDVVDARDPRLATLPVGALPPQPVRSTARAISAVLKSATPLSRAVVLPPCSICAASPLMSSPSRLAWVIL
jgi:hypothetical protein